MKQVLNATGEPIVFCTPEGRIIEELPVHLMAPQVQNVPLGTAEKIASSIPTFMPVVTYLPERVPGALILVTTEVKAAALILDPKRNDLCTPADPVYTFNPEKKFVGYKGIAIHWSVDVLQTP